MRVSNLALLIAAAPALGLALPAMAGTAPAAAGTDAAASYPTCSAKVTDHCIQREGRAAKAGGHHGAMHHRHGKHNHHK